MLQKTRVSKPKALNQTLNLGPIGGIEVMVITT